MALQGTPQNMGTVQADASSKKQEAIAKFKARKAEKAKKQLEDATKLRDELVKANLLDKLSADSKNFVISLCSEKKGGVQSSGNSVFTLLFGDKPAVGQHITLEQVFAKTYKGKSTMTMLLKRWAEKGIVVEFAQAPKMLESTYTIKALP